MILQICTAQDSDEMVRLLATVFPRQDPPAIAAGLTPSEFEAFVSLYCPRAQSAGLTIVARSAEANELMGVLLTEDSASDPPPGIERLSAKFNPIFDILGLLEPTRPAGHSGSPGERLHLFLLGVAPRFAGQGVAQQLVAACVANGARKGYCRAVTEATNKTSQHIFRKQGFVEHARMSYRDHRFQGQAFFKSIAEHGGPARMEKCWCPPQL
jgi:ribosomal protein S18 acetylase RimI-like enzyme